VAAPDQIRPTAAEERQAVLDRALRYPYDRPSGSFVVDVGTGAVALLDDAGPTLASGRTAVLAVGSNASPEQLTRKFAGHSGVIPVVAVALRVHDAVYAARISRYGAVPATLAPSPGTTVALHATLLDEEQLEVMHRSESVGSAYELGVVPADYFDVSVPLPEDVPTYDAAQGPLLLDGDLVALAAVRAVGRRLRALPEAEVLAEVAALLGMTTAELVFGVVGHPPRHAELNDRLVELRAGAQRP
jgi:hypothetical protein